ncbi:MAG: STAS domain-containing protein [Alphaproteobacteria bacterium]|nr:STAS domain-containing protein [Alphaproteobacteria bacterium]
MLTHLLQEQEEALVIALDGDVDLEHAPTVRKLLLECIDKGKDVILDFSKVGYLDSSGIETLVEADREAQDKGVRLHLAAVGTIPRRVLTLAKLDEVLTIHASLEDALADRKTKNGG